MNVIFYEYGQFWTWSVVNMVCIERVCNEGGLLWMWSLMNVVCTERVFNEQVSYEGCL